MDPQKQIQRMVDAVQPHCDEPILSAMSCSHAGSMSSLLFSKLTGGMARLARTSELPNAVLIAVGADTVFAFDYKARGFKLKVKKEVARWGRADLEIASEATSMMSYLTITTGSGDIYAMEMARIMGGGAAVDLFLASLGSA